MESISLQHNMSQVSLMFVTAAILVESESRSIVYWSKSISFLNSSYVLCTTGRYSISAHVLALGYLDLIVCKKSNVGSTVKLRGGILSEPVVNIMMSWSVACASFSETDNHKFKHYNQ